MFSYTDRVFLGRSIESTYLCKMQIKRKFREKEKVEELKYLVTSEPESREKQAQKLMELYRQAH